MMRNSDYIITKIGQREYRAINRLMGMLLIAIAVQFVINGIRLAFPLFPEDNMKNIVMPKDCSSIVVKKCCGVMIYIMPMIL